MEYKSVDDNKDIAQYSKNLLIDIDNNITPTSKLFYMEFE